MGHSTYSVNQKLIAMRFLRNASRAAGMFAKSKYLWLLVIAQSCLLIAAHARDITTCTKHAFFFQDTVIVRGKVAGSEEGVGLPQVSVQNLVTRKGTFTNIQGEFSIGAHQGR
jgi:hypothetical protein